MSRLTKVSIDSVLYDIGSKGINSYATLSELVNEKVSELYDGCIAWCSEDSKYYQWLSTNEIISIYGRWRELEFGSEFQVGDPTVDASTEKYKGKIIQYVGIDDVTSGFKRGCFYESRLSNVINYVVATVDASTVGTYYTVDDYGNYNPITLIGDGTGYDASTIYYKKQDVEVYAWAYINSLKVETEFDENSENAVANGIITQKFKEVIQDYTDKNDALKEYVDTDVTTALQQYADDLIADVEEVTEDKVWSNSKTKDYVDTALEDYTTSATEILQADFDALDEETKLANNYHCTDTGRMYYKGILYGDKKPIELTYEEYKTLEEAGKIEADVDYVVHSNESGVLLSDLDINHGDSEISTYEVIENLKSDVTTLQGDITELANKEDVYTTDSIANTLYYACEYFGLDCRNQYQVLEIEVIDAKGQNLKFNSIYKHEVLHHAQVISENGITLKAIDTVGTLAFENASDYTIKVKHIDICPDSVGDTLVTVINRANKNALASDVNPTIDISKVFSDGTLNIATLYGTYGNGRYVIVGQGTTGNGSATIDIWTLVGGAISYIVNALYSPKTSTMFVGYTYENPTIDFDANYFTHCNHIAKVCTLA